MQKLALIVYLLDFLLNADIRYPILMHMHRGQDKKS